VVGCWHILLPVESYSYLYHSQSHSYSYWLVLLHIVAGASHHVYLLQTHATTATGALAGRDQRERERETISFSLMHAWILDSGRESIDELMSNEEAPKFGE
jgi:hypothetical protein